jgi:hypothetical protein
MANRIAFWYVSIVTAYDVAGVAVFLALAIFSTFGAVVGSSPNDCEGFKR